MSMGSYAEKLIAAIDELYLYQAGPLGSLICEETLAHWKMTQKQLQHMQLPTYIEELINELPDDKQKKGFIKDLQQTEPVKSHVPIQQFLKTIYFN